MSLGSVDPPEVRVYVRVLPDPPTGSVKGLEINESTVSLELLPEAGEVTRLTFDGILGLSSTPQDLLQILYSAGDLVLGGADAVIVSYDTSSSLQAISLTGGDGGDTQPFLSMISNYIFDRFDESSRDVKDCQKSMYLQMLEASPSAIFDTGVDGSRDSPLSSSPSILQQHVQIPGLSQHLISNKNELSKLLEKSVLSSTTQRRDSFYRISRLILQVQSTDGGDQTTFTRRSVLTLCDLARYTHLENMTPRGMGPWAAVERCISGAPHEEQKYVLNELILSRIIQETCSEKGIVVLVLSIDSHPKAQQETFNMLMAASNLRRGQRRIPSSEPSEEMDLQEALREIDALRKQLKSAPAAKPVVPQTKANCSSCAGLRDKIARLEKENARLRTTNQTVEEELRTFRNQSLLRPNGGKCDHQFDETKKSSMMSPLPNPVQGSNACAKHDLNDCVLCQLFISNPTSLLSNHSSLPALSEQSGNRAQVPEVKMDPHGSPFPLSSFCKAHRVSNCLLCADHHASKNLSPLNHTLPSAHASSFHEDASPSPKNENVLPALDTSALTSSAPRANQRYRYSGVNDDLGSEFETASHLTLRATGKKTRPKKKKTNDPKQIPLEPLLAPYLPSLKPRKKGRKGSSKPS